MGVRKINANDRSITGSFHSEKMNERVHFESSLEKDFYLWCEFNGSVTEYLYQPLSIVYKNDYGVNSIYTPDVLVHFLDSRPTKLIEIKYSTDLKENFTKYKPKFKAAIKYCLERDWKFELITESIRTPLLDNIKFLNQFKNNTLDQELKDQILTHLASFEKFTPRIFLETFAKTDYIKGIGLRYFWTLTLRREIICDLTTPISMNTVFYLSDFNDEKYK